MFDAMNTQLLKSLFFRLLTLPVIASLLFSCGRKSNLEDVSGDVVVQIPVSETQKDQVQYKLKDVTLKSISHLKTVEGSFARFYYSPGQAQSGLVGDAPQARFIKSSRGAYVPVDTLSQQMATIYYHLQNLIELSQSLGVSKAIAHQMTVGIHVQVGQSALAKNNAFYDGVSDSFLFVPFTSQEIPIAVNSGIIGHEYFHSIFFNTVLKNYKPLKSNKKDVTLYNETYIRGLNEGLADFWGWLYSEDENFMQWSLSNYSKNRKLSLSESMKGVFESTQKIFANTSRVSSSPERQGEYLSSYIYEIGTPIARFLKVVTQTRVNDQVTLAQSKKMTSELLLKFLNDLNYKATHLADDEILEADQIFSFFAQNTLDMSVSECGLVAQYVQKIPGSEDQICVQKDNGFYKIDKVVVDEK